MYLGKHVVAESEMRLRPSVRLVRASTSTPWQIAPTGRDNAQ